MRNIINKILMIITVLILISSSSVKADTEIQSGIYSVNNSVYHESEIGMSMARSYLNENMLVKITKEEVVFTIGFSGTEYMNNYRIKVNDVEVPVEIVEENKDAGTIKLQVKADSKDVKLSTAIYVDPMGRDVEFQIIPDYTTMTLVEAIEEEVPEESAEEQVLEDVSENENEITEESKSNNAIKIVVSVVGIIILTIIVAVVLKKRK